MVDGNDSFTNLCNLGLVRHYIFKPKLLIGCIKTLYWLVNNYSLLGLKTKHTPLLQ